MANKKVVWISRPRARAAGLAQALSDKGFSPLLAPAIRIDESTNESIRNYCAALNDYDLHIIVSAAAADALRRVLPPISSPVQALTLGNETAAALPTHYECINTANEILDSKALLTLPQLAAPSEKYKRIAIIGGASNNTPQPAPHLASTLKERGFDAQAIACYRRTFLPIDNALSAQGQDGNIHAAVAYSSETLAAMCAMLAPPHDWFFHCPLFVIHKNIEAAAKKLGFQTTHTAAPAQMANHIKSYFQ